MERASAYKRRRINVKGVKNSVDSQLLVGMYVGIFKKTLYIKPLTYCHILGIFRNKKEKAPPSH
jgi:hypothetical protein